MAHFNESSLQKLNSCDIRLQEICKEVIKLFNFTVIEGHRGEEKQKQYFSEGKSKLKYPASKHNKHPALAVDIAPYPIDWKDTKSFYYLAGLMIATSNAKNIKLRWGGNWRGSDNLKDNKFLDLVHFEIGE